MAPLEFTRMAGMSFWLDLRQPLRCAYRTDAATQGMRCKLEFTGSCRLCQLGGFGAGNRRF